VTGMPSEITKEDIRSHFKDYKLKDADLIKLSKDSWLSTFRDEEEAHRAVLEKHKEEGLNLRTI